MIDFFKKIGWCVLVVCACAFIDKIIEHYCDVFIESSYFVLGVCISMIYDIKKNRQ